MKRTVVHTDKVPPARVPLSQAIEIRDWVFVSGQLGMDPKTGRLIEGGIKAETRQVCENLKAVLEAGGSSLAGVAKVTIYLADLAESDGDERGLPRILSERAARAHDLSGRRAGGRSAGGDRGDRGSIGLKSEL